MMLLLLSVVVAVLWGEYYLLVQGVVVRGRQEGRDGGSSPGKKIIEIRAALLASFSPYQHTQVYSSQYKHREAYSSQQQPSVTYGSLGKPSAAYRA